MGKRKKKSGMKEYAWGYGMIAPLVLGLGVFYFFPVFKVFFDSQSVQRIRNLSAAAVFHGPSG